MRAWRRDLLVLLCAAFIPAVAAADWLVAPFAGVAFGWTPGQTTSLAGLQHGGVLVGMLLVAAAGRLGWGSLRAWCSRPPCSPRARG